MQVTPFTKRALCSPTTFISLCGWEKYSAVSHPSIFDDCLNSNRHHSRMQMHLEQNREVVENQRDQGSKSGC